MPRRPPDSEPADPVPPIVIARVFNTLKDLGYKRPPDATSLRDTVLFLGLLITAYREGR